jgi:general secretion pathway protein I
MMNNKTSVQAGFTLIEVMVAVAVLGIALPALMYSMIAQVESSGYLRDKLFAQWVASNQITEIRLQNRMNGRLKKGKDQGSVEMANQKWYWRSNIKVFAQAEFKDIYGIEVAVYQDKDAKDDESLIRSVAILREYSKQGVAMPQPEIVSDDNDNSGNQSSGGTTQSSGGTTQSSGGTTQDNGDSDATQ